MFSDKVMNSLFGNIEEIYSFQKGFLLQLEASINQDRADLSRIGGCFLDHVRLENKILLKTSFKKFR